MKDIDNILKQIVMESGDAFNNIEEVRDRLLVIKDRLNKLTGFIKGLQYNKDEKIDCNWEYDFYFLNNLIDKLVKEMAKNGCPNCEKEMEEESQ